MRADRTAGKTSPPQSPPASQRRHWPCWLGTVIVFLITLPFVFVLDIVLQIIGDAVDVVVLLTTIAISVAVPIGILWLLGAPAGWYAVAAPAGIVAAFPLARWYARSTNDA